MTLPMTSWETWRKIKFNEIKNSCVKKLMTTRQNLVLKVCRSSVYVQIFGYLIGLDRCIVGAFCYWSFTVTSHERLDVLNHRQLDFRPTACSSWHHRNHQTQHCGPFGGSPYIELIMQKVSSCHDVIEARTAFWLRISHFYYWSLVTYMR